MKERGEGGEGREEREKRGWKRARANGEARKRERRTGSREYFEVRDVVGGVVAEVLPKLFL